MNTLNQSAPPATAPKGGQDFIRFDPFPKNDSHVLTVVAYNYNPTAEFLRTDDDTGAKTTEIAPGIELFFGTMIGGKPYFVAPWAVKYSLHEKANYAKWYEAATGNVASAGSKPDDMVGKFILGAIKIEQKTGAKGTPYTKTKLANVSAVPSILAGTGTDMKALLPALQAVLAGGEKKEPAPF